jgi:hypothetical protein
VTAKPPSSSGSAVRSNSTPDEIIITGESVVQPKESSLSANQFREKLRIQFQEAEKERHALVLELGQGQEDVEMTEEEKREEFEIERRRRNSHSHGDSNTNEESHVNDTTSTSSSSSNGNNSNKATTATTTSTTTHNGLNLEAQRKMIGSPNGHLYDGALSIDARLDAVVTEQQGTPFPIHGLDEQIANNMIENCIG